MCPLHNNYCMVLIYWYKYTHHYVCRKQDGQCHDNCYGFVCIRFFGPFLIVGYIILCSECIRVALRRFKNLNFPGEACTQDPLSIVAGATSLSILCSPLSPTPKAKHLFIPLKLEFVAQPLYKSIIIIIKHPYNVCSHRFFSTMLTLFLCIPRPHPTINVRCTPSPHYN